MLVAQFLDYFRAAGGVIADKSAAGLGLEFVNQFRGEAVSVKRGASRLYRDHEFPMAGQGVLADA